MKQFLLFSGHAYYPNGGMDDFDTSFDTLEEAEIEYLRLYNSNDIYNSRTDWGHIYDMKSNQILTHFEDDKKI